MPFPTTSSPLARALAERNYDQPTPVQLAVLADDAVDRDLLVSAQTGSGKTVAYGLAMAKDLLDGAERFEPAAAPLALIVAPTRELALQVQRELAWLYEHADARVVSCVGGMDPRREQRELAEGAHIVVGTPGRLCDHLRRGRLDISGLKVVVLDEADEMLNLGFREDMEFILETTPDTRRTLLFSATFPRGIVALAKQYQEQAFRIEVAGRRRRPCRYRIPRHPGGRRRCRARGRQRAAFP
ncbi:superfamily II DNA/RNA helicase [Bradyrhizobium elkanii]